MIALAPSWEVVVAANALLGAQQGVCWSTSLIMHMDVAARRHRGLAVGINELFGYGGTAVTAYAAGWLAATTGPRPAPFLLQEALVVLGLTTAACLIRDTQVHVRRELTGPSRASRRHRFVAVCQAGLVTKVADVVA